MKSISRFARNTMECLETIRELKALGISVFFEEHNIDTKMVSSEMLTAVIAACAQAESESISGNMKWSIKKRMKEGEFNTCRAGTGFYLTKGGLMVQPEAVPVIQKIYTEYVNGLNSREIAERLNSEKALGRAWNRKLVDYILTNERYAGNALLQKTYRTDTFPTERRKNRGEQPMYYVEGSNPAMIDKELFDQAVQLRKRRRHDKRQEQGRPFAQKLSCDICGSWLRSKKVNGIWYWVCRTHEEDIERCALLPIQEMQIIAAFQRIYYKLKYHSEVLDGLLKNLTSARNRRMLWSPAVIELNKEISDILSQSHALSLLKKQGAVDSDVFISMSNQLAEQLRSAKQRKQKLQNQEEDQTIAQTECLIEALAAGAEFLDTFDEELFCELIDKIIVDSNTKIRFRLKNGLKLPEAIERTVR